jgi:hypothetical protein
MLTCRWCCAATRSGATSRRARGLAPHRHRRPLDLEPCAQGGVACRELLRQHGGRRAALRHRARDPRRGGDASALSAIRRRG